MKSNIPLFRLYVWKGINKRGRVEKGIIPAEDELSAEEKLMKEEIEVLSVKEKSRLFPNKQRKAIKTYDIMLFFRQLATMIDAGIPLVQALGIISSGLENINMMTLLRTLYNDVSAGDTLSEAMGKHPKRFGPLVCNLIAVGEQSGTLDRILNQISNYLEKAQTLKSRIKKAMFYPIAMLVVTVSVAILLLTFIVPRFRDMYQAFGADLPGPTKVVMNLSEGLQKYWWLILLIIGSVIVSYITLKRKSEKFRRFLNLASLRLPLFGPLIQKAAIARITRTLAIALSAGIPLVAALESVSKVAGNIVYAEAVTQARRDVIAGYSFSESIKASKLFPPMVLQMVSIGEQSGELDDMLEKVALFYEEQVDIAVDGISTLIEPIMLVLLGVVVGGFVISMYLPIFKLGTVL